MTIGLVPLYIGSKKKMAIQLAISILFIVFLAQSLFNVEPILDGLQKESHVMPIGDVSNVVFFVIPVLAVIPGLFVFLLLKRELIL